MALWIVIAVLIFLYLFISPSKQMTKTEEDKQSAIPTINIKRPKVRKTSVIPSRSEPAIDLTLNRLKETKAQDQKPTKSKRLRSVSIKEAMVLKEILEPPYLNR